MSLRPRLLRWAGGTLAVLVLATLICEAAGWPFLQHPLQNAMTRAGGVPVVLDGRFRARLIFGPWLEIDHLQVGAGGGVEVPHLIDAERVRLGWRWRDLWRWSRGDPLRLETLHAGRIDAWLVRDAAGHASWQLGAPRQPDRASPASAELPHFGSLVVERGRIVFDDKPLATELRVDINGAEGDSLRAEGQAAGYRATLSGHYGALRLKLQLRSGGVLPLAQDSERVSELVTLRVEGQAGAARLLFDGKAGALLGGRQLDGVLRVSGPSLAAVGEPLNITLPQTPPFELDGRLSHDAGVWGLRADKATIGQSRLGGDFRYDTLTQPGLLSGRLTGTRLALADLGPAVGAVAKAGSGSGAKPAARRVLPQRPFDLPSLRAMDADVQVAIDELDFGSDGIDPLRQLQTHLRLRAGVLELADLKSVVAGGRFGGSIQLDSNTSPAQLAANLRFDGIDIASWVRALRAPQAGKAGSASSSAALKQQREQARAGEQPVQSYLTGSLSGGLKATGAGKSTGEILAHLDGQAQVVLREGTLSHLVTELAGLDVAQSLGVLVSGDRPLPLRCARLDLVAHQGIVQPRLAVLDNDDSALEMSGKIDLRDESLDLRATVQPKDFSPLSLNAPILVTGSLGTPKVGVDRKKVAAKVAGAAVLGVVVGPLAALLPLMDFGQGKDKTPDPDPCAPAPASSAKAASKPAR